MTVSAETLLKLCEAAGLDEVSATRTYPSRLTLSRTTHHAQHNASDR